MDILPPERHHLKLSTGTLPCFKITTGLAASHPFAQQLDIIFPSDPRLERALLELETSYGVAKVGVAELVEASTGFVSSDDGSDLLIVTASRQEDDVWCIDSRGYLTISACKETYERLGLVGKRMPFKAHQDAHVISLPLQPHAQSVKNTAKMKQALKEWDQRRVEEFGKTLGSWDVVFCRSKDSIQPPDLPLTSSSSQTKIIQVKSTFTTLEDVYVPVPSLSPPPHTQNSKTPKEKEESQDALEDYNNHILSLFEWIGMATIHAQRLYLNDRVDPYVAVYEPPEGSRSGSVTHLRWDASGGLLGPGFVKRVLDLIIGYLETNESTTTPFVGITCNAYTNTPIGYIPCKDPTSTSSSSSSSNKTPIRYPRPDAEDTWSLILEPNSHSHSDSLEQQQQQEKRHVDFCLVESIGDWDTRWG